MKTEKKLQRQCVLCGKIINYVLVEDDEWDDMGRNMNYGMIEEFRKIMEE